MCFLPAIYNAYWTKAQKKWIFTFWSILFLVCLLLPSGNVMAASHQTHKHASLPAIRYHEISLPALKSPPYAMVLGPDGSIWFSDQNGDTLGHISKKGKVTLIPLIGERVWDFILGPDKNFWFTDYITGILGRLTPSGQITTFPFSFYTYSLASGPDGNLWFIADGVLGRVTLQGSITLYNHYELSGVSKILFDHAGNLWFTTDVEVGYITPTGHLVDVRGYGRGDDVEAILYPQETISDIFLGPDHNFWVTVQSVGPDDPQVSTYYERIPPSGNGITTSSYSTQITHLLVGPDKNIWFLEDGGILEKMTLSGVTTKYQGPRNVNQLIAGGDKKFWFSENDQKKIGFFVPPGCPNM